MYSKSIVSSISHIHTHKRDKNVSCYLLPTALVLFQTLFWKGKNKITDESLQIMIPFMDLIKIGDPSIFSSFASHEENVISLLLPKAKEA